MSDTTTTTTTTPSTPETAAAAPATAADLAATNERLAELIRTLRTPAAAPAAAPAPAQPARAQRATEAQLAAEVDAGRMTQAQMIAVLRHYDREDMAAEIERRTREASTAASREARVIAQQEALITAHPDLGRQGSDLWNECVAAYTEMVQLGAPVGPVTELAAARQVTAGLRARTTPAPDAEDTTSRQPSRETTAPATSTTRRSAPRDVWHGIPDDARAFYAAQIKRGQWKGDDDPRLKTVLDGLRTRLAAPGRRRTA